MPVTDLLVGAVEVLHVVQVKVRRGDVGAASEPPDASLGLEVTVVEVHRGCKGVLGVHHRTQAARKERNPLAGLIAGTPVGGGELAPEDWRGGLGLVCRKTVASTVTDRRGGR